MRLDAGPSRLVRACGRIPLRGALRPAPLARPFSSTPPSPAPRPSPPRAALMTTAASIPHPHPGFERLAARLSGSQPCFGTAGEKIELLPSPTAFHDRLLEMVRRARRRILISTLYIGTEEASLVDAVDTALATRPGLRASFVLDYNRATRPGPGSPQSTVHMLIPLLEKYGDRVDVLLYRSPKLKGVLEKIVPPRFNEGWGTWHAKYYAVDDDVVLSGANLAASYFTNRQDRYVYIASHPSLLSYLFSITRLISDYTYRVTAHARPGTLGAHGVPLGGCTGGSDAGALWRETSLDPRGFQSHAQATLRAFQQAWRASNAVRARDAADAGADTWFWPVIQAGVLGLREEEQAMGMVWDAVREAGAAAGAGAGGVEVDLTSGYFGLYKAYKRAVIESPATVQVIAASPKANGFYGSKGLSRLIPEGYTLLERRFHKAVVRAGREWDGSAGVRLQEWEREGWTYHAKGMWLSPPEQSPFMTFIGSSNLSTRSLNLDAELSLLLSTSSPALRERLGDELTQLRAHAHDVGTATWKLDERRVSLLAKVLVALGVEAPPVLLAITTPPTRSTRATRSARSRAQSTPSEIAPVRRILQWRLTVSQPRYTTRSKRKWGTTSNTSSNVISNDSDEDDDDRRFVTHESDDEDDDIQIVIPSPSSSESEDEDATARVHEAKMGRNCRHPDGTRHLSYPGPDDGLQSLSERSAGFEAGDAVVGDGDGGGDGDDELEPPVDQSSARSEAGEGVQHDGDGDGNGDDAKSLNTTLDGATPASTVAPVNPRSLRLDGLGPTAGRTSPTCATQDARLFVFPSSAPAGPSSAHPSSARPASSAASVVHPAAAPAPPQAGSTVPGMLPSRPSALSTALSTGLAPSTPAAVDSCRPPQWTVRAAVSRSSNTLKYLGEQTEKVTNAAAEFKQRERNAATYLEQREPQQRDFEVETARERVNLEAGIEKARDPLRRAEASMAEAKIEADEAYDALKGV